MRFATLALAFVALSFAGTALAQVTPVPAAPRVERLCGDVAGNLLAFGTQEQDVTEAALAQARERAVASGFEDVEPLYTAWSQRLYAVDYTLDVPGGDPLDSWEDEVRAALEAAGWATTEDGFMSFAAASFVKEFAAPDGPRQLSLDLSLHGVRRGITLRCGDADLLYQNQSELDGVLPAGSARPVPPPPAPPLEDFLARLDCTDPALLELFAKAEDLGDAGALVEARLGPPADLNAEANYRHRLLKWVRWRMLASEQIDEEALWAIEEKAAADNPVKLEDIDGFMATLGGLIEAQQAKDSGRLCKAYREAIVTMAEDNARDARRNAALAALLEDEAARRGISLD